MGVNGWLSMFEQVAEWDDALLLHDLHAQHKGGVATGRQETWSTYDIGGFFGD